MKRLEIVPFEYSIIMQGAQPLRMMTSCGCRDQAGRATSLTALFRKVSFSQAPLVLLLNTVGFFFVHTCYLGGYQELMAALLRVSVLRCW
jgi:hypothetical protein